MTVQARPRLGFVRMPYHLLGVAAVPRPRADCAAALASAASAALRCAAAPAAADSALLGLDGTMGDASGVGAVARSAGMTVPVAPSGAGEASRWPQADSMSVAPMAITRCPPVRRCRLFLPVMRYLLCAVQALQWGHCSGPSTFAITFRRWFIRSNPDSTVPGSSLQVGKSQKKRMFQHETSLWYRCPRVLEQRMLHEGAAVVCRADLRVGLIGPPQGECRLSALGAVLVMRAMRWRYNPAHRMTGPVTRSRRVFCTASSAHFKKRTNGFVRESTRVKPCDSRVAF